MLADSWEAGWDCWLRDTVLSTQPPGLPHSTEQVPPGREGKLPFLLEDRLRVGPGSLPPRVIGSDSRMDTTVVPWTRETQGQDSKARGKKWVPRSCGPRASFNHSFSQIRNLFSQRGLALGIIYYFKEIRCWGAPPHTLRNFWIRLKLYFNTITPRSI